MFLIIISHILIIFFNNFYCLQITDSSALKTLSRLFSMGDVNLCTNTSARQSPLMLAALHGGVDICSLLIAHGANINAQDASGNTALMYAIEHGHVDVVKCLLGCRDLDLTLVDNVRIDLFFHFF